MKLSSFEDPSEVIVLGRSGQVVWHGRQGVRDPGAVDPVRLPPDPRLVARLGASRVARTGLLPWRQCGPDCVVLACDPDTFLRQRHMLEECLGPVRLALCDQRTMRETMFHAVGPTLAARAETRVSEDDSCRTWRTRSAVRAGAVGLAGAVLLALAAPGLLLSGLTGLAVVALCLTAFLKIAGLVLSFRRPRIHRGAPPSAVPIDSPVVSLLVPLLREAEIADHLLQRLGRLDYPAHKLDLCLILEEDDDQTRATLDRTELPGHAQVITVPKGTLRTKPRALNYALDFARGSIIGIYDAEDAPAPDQIAKVVARFAERSPRVACLQGVLDFYNTDRNWIARCFTLEYAAWFRVVLPALERMGLVVPLGGTTLFLRRDAIEAVGGWDAHNVTEDADLGVRLARHGYRTELIDSVTMEEANARAWPWVRQRSRWLKGYAMTYAVHMRRPLRLWRDLGAWRFFGVQVLFLGTLLQLATAPLLWSFWIQLAGIAHPLAATMPRAAFLGLVGLFLAVEAITILLHARAAWLSGRAKLGLWGPTLALYYPFATLALYKALRELLSRPFYWDKTAHGAHGGAPASDPIAPPGPLPRPA